MLKQIRSTQCALSAACLIALVVIILAGAILPGTILSSTWARATDDCAAAPRSPAPNGQHWWYRTDRVTQRKCWFLGPQDETALKAALRARADASSSRPAAETSGPAAQLPSTRSSPPTPVGEAEIDNVQPSAQAPARSIPFLVHWSELLESAGIIHRGESAMTAWAQERTIQEPATTGARSEEDEAQTLQTVAALSDITDGAMATLPQMLLLIIAALLIAGGLSRVIFRLARARRQRAYRRKAEWRAASAYERAPATFAPQHPRDLDGGLSASAHRHDGGEEYKPIDVDDLRRILRALERHAV